MLNTVSTVRSAANIARSGDPQQAIKQALKHRADAYERDPRLLLADVKRVKREYDNLMALLRGEVGKTWGKKEVRVATPKRYVKYTQNYQSRAIVNFDTGEIAVETVDETNPMVSLKNAIVTTLLTPNDPRATDLFSDAAVKLSSEREPYLLGLVQDARGRPIATPDQAEAFADRSADGPRYAKGGSGERRKNRDVRQIHHGEQFCAPAGGEIPSRRWIAMPRNTKSVRAWCTPSSRPRATLIRSPSVRRRPTA